MNMADAPQAEIGKEDNESNQNYVPLRNNN